MEVIATREALINSEGSKILAKRAADRLHRDELESEYRSSVAAADAAIGHGLGTSTSTSAPDIFSRVSSGNARTGSGLTSTRRSAEATTREEDATTDNSSPTTWERNAYKLRSLRTTVLDSGRAREIAGKLRLAQPDNCDRSAAHRLEEIGRPSPPRLQETVQHSPPQGASFDNMANSPQHRVRYDDMALRTDANNATEEEAGRGGKRSPGGARGIRWIRGIATRVSRVGRQARGWVARVHGRASRKTDGDI